MKTMTLEDLGYHPDFEAYRKKNQLDSFGVGRVILEHRERYVVRTAEKEYEAEVIGNLRFASQSPADFPAVGDWVAIAEYDEDKVLIHAVLPRRTSIERQAVGKRGEKQIIASNIDYAFIVQSADRDFSMNRLERYLTLCHASKVRPMIVLNKIDLLDDGQIQAMVSSIRQRLDQQEVFTISNKTRAGIDRLYEAMLKGKTYCLLGSSGVGKSSLVNTLTGKELMKTNPISTSTRKGRHVTSHRELVVLDHGAILIDNPGMREVGMAGSAAGLDQTFAAIVELSPECKYKDCTHTSEKGCAVLAAMERGELDELAHENYLKMVRENAHFESTVAERRRKDKDFGKVVKHYKNIKNRQ
jgi:ribosome biogenesis GTPase